MNIDVGNILIFIYNNDRVIKIGSEKTDVLKSQIRVISTITGKTRFITLTVYAKRILRVLKIRRTLKLILLLHNLSNGLLYYYTDTIDLSVV